MGLLPPDTAPGSRRCAGYGTEARLQTLDTLVSVLDWDCAGTGPAGVDLGSLRCDAAVCFGADAAEYVLNGWQTTAQWTADDLAYWDAAAALSTPPDMGWFAQAIGGQGRGDLSQPILLQRRNDFLAAALYRLDP